MSDYSSIEDMSYRGIEHQMHRCQRAMEGAVEVHRWIDTVTEKTIGITFATDVQPFTYEYDLAYMRIKGREKGIEPKYEGKLEPEQIIGEFILRKEYLTTSGWLAVRARLAKKARLWARPLENIDVSPKFL